MFEWLRNRKKLARAVVAMETANKRAAFSEETCQHWEELHGKLLEKNKELAACNDFYRREIERFKEILRSRTNEEIMLRKEVIDVRNHMEELRNEFAREREKRVDALTALLQVKSITLKRLRQLIDDTEKLTQ
jgi:hypothetical protein